MTPGSRAIDAVAIFPDPRLPDRTKPGGRFGPLDLEEIERGRSALAGLEGYRFRFLDDHGRLVEELVGAPPELALNLCDTGYRNRASLEGLVPGLLERLRIPYSGTAPSALALCYDKRLCGQLAASLGVAVPREIVVGEDEREALERFSYPALVKPDRGDGSVGITERSVVAGPGEVLGRARELVRELPGRRALLQEFLTGPEYSVGLLGNPGADLRPLSILEADFSRLPSELPPIRDFRAKTDPESRRSKLVASRPARLAAAAAERLIADSKLLFERLGCRDYARFDFRCDAAGGPKLLDVNPNPGWGWDGSLATMAKYAGMAYPELLAAILEAAHRRCGLENMALPSVRPSGAGGSEFDPGG